jgi:hypothetical protein
MDSSRYEFVTGKREERARRTAMEAARSRL